MRICLMGLCIALLLGTCAACAQSYQNPVLGGMNPDPSVVRVGSDYYLVTSSFEYFPGCPVYHSRDLVHWQRIGYALERPEQFAALKDEHPSLYACTLRFHAGTFYAITTDVRGGGNFFVKTSNPAGPWSLPVVIDHGMFDPSLLFDNDGTVYYTRRGPDAAHPIVQARIDPESGRLLTPLQTVSKGNISPDAEGPHLYHIGGWYYLSQAEGGSRFLHMETVARSHSPWGPFESDPHNPWVSQHEEWDYPVRSLGHCDLVDTPTHDWWTVCLGTRHANSSHFSIGRETFLFHVSWRDGWPEIDRRDTHGLTVQRSAPGDDPFPAPPVRDNFSSTRLGMEWNTFGPTGMQVMSFTERPGFLRLRGQPAGLSFRQTSSFVGRRQTQWRTVSTTRLEFSPRDENDLAGLTVFMSPRFHYDLVRTVCAGSPCVKLLKHVGDISVVAAQAAAPAGAILLRIESEATTYRFLFADDDGNWKTLGSGEELLIASEVANVWSGAYIGMFSQSAQAAGTPAADFDWFDYTPTPIP